jgi:hypothetical protein
MRGWGELGRSGSSPEERVPMRDADSAEDTYPEGDGDRAALGPGWGGHTCRGEPGPEGR